MKARKKNSCNAFAKEAAVFDFRGLAFYRLIKISIDWSDKILRFLLSADDNI